MLARLIVAVVLFAATPAAAELSEADHLALDKAIVAQHILPRMAAFADGAAVLPVTAEAACTTRRAADIKAVQDTFVRAMDTWEAIQHVRFGPVELFLRDMRISFWPDPRNNVGRELDALLKKDPGAITETALVSMSVAVQGFPALERLLFDEGAAARLAERNPPGDHACTAVRAIAANVATMAREMNREWQQTYAAVLEHAGPDQPRSLRQRDVTQELFKALYTATELAGDRKLTQPLGSSVKNARPRLAEAWRSGRSLENIRTNLSAGQALYLDGFSATVRAVDHRLDTLLTQAFTQTVATAQGIAVPLERGVTDPRARPQFEKLAREIKALKTLLAQRLAAVLDVPVGFNSMDGD